MPYVSFILRCLFMVFSAVFGLFVWNLIAGLFSWSGQKATGLTVIYGEVAEHSLVAGGLLIVLGLVMVRLVRASVG